MLQWTVRNVKCAHSLECQENEYNSATTGICRTDLWNSFESILVKHKFDWIDFNF